MTDQDREDERTELMRDRTRQRAYQRRMLSSPDCRDPDHPGCERCADEHDKDADQ